MPRQTSDIETNEVTPLLFMTVPTIQMRTVMCIATLPLRRFSNTAIALVDLSALLHIIIPKYQ
jgi:hypothetical protein